MKDDHKGNVRSFNTFVAHQRDQLTGRGQVVDELLTHLFDAYLTGVPNEEFHRYIESYRNRWDDGETMDAEQLMRNALVKYETITQRQASINEGEVKVMALVAKKEEANKDQAATMIGLLKQLEANLAQKTTSNNGNKQSKPRKMPEWKKKAPSDKDPKTKTENGFLNKDLEE
jgi:hypothetical protein